MNKAISIGLVFAIVFTALAHGAVEAWSVAGFALIMILLLAFWAIKIVKEKIISIQLPATVWPLLALLVYVSVQSLAFIKSDGQIVSLSMDVEATRAALPVLFFLIVAFIVAVNFFNTTESLNKLVTFLTFYGFAMALFGLIQNFSWNGKIYWVRPTEFAGFGPFVNHNHFAGYMEMLIPMPVALVVGRAIRKDVWMIYLFAALLMSASLILSLSRGGAISLFASLLFIALGKSRLPRNARKRSVSSTHTNYPITVWLKGIGSAVAIALILLAGVVWLGAEPVLTRLAHTIDQANSSSADTFLSRGWIWRGTLTMIQTHPLTGVGFGAYQTVFPATTNSLENLVTHSHNDYLQIVADCGLAGGALALWFLVLLFRAMWRSIQSTDAKLAAIALGSSAGIFAMLVHSFLDFNLQIPSNALLFLVLCAIVSHIAANPGVAAKALQKSAPSAFAKVDEKE